MKLVINVSETQYRECIEYKNQKYAPTCKDVDSMFLSIANGTPLPQGRGRLIDADTLCNDLVDCWDIADKEKKELINVVMANIVTPIIVNQPTIIEADKGDKE